MINEELNNDKIDSWRILQVLHKYWPQSDKLNSFDNKSPTICIAESNPETIRKIPDTLDKVDKII